jgi:hypothetical protein
MYQVDRTVAVAHDRLRTSRNDVPHGPETLGSLLTHAQLVIGGFSAGATGCRQNSPPPEVRGGPVGC